MFSFFIFLPKYSPIWFIDAMFPCFLKIFFYFFHVPFLENMVGLPPFGFDPESLPCEFSKGSGANQQTKVPLATI